MSVIEAFKVAITGGIGVQSEFVVLDVFGGDGEVGIAAMLCNAFPVIFSPDAVYIQNRIEGVGADIIRKGAGRFKSLSQQLSGLATTVVCFTPIFVYTIMSMVEYKLARFQMTNIGGKSSIATQTPVTSSFDRHDPKRSETIQLPMCLSFQSKVVSGVIVADDEDYPQDPDCELDEVCSGMFCNP